MLMDNQSKKYLITSFIILAWGVVLGAFGAHALKESLTEHYLDVPLTLLEYS